MFLLAAAIAAAGIFLMMQAEWKASAPEMA
jgi:hypothetical protein